MQAAGDEYERIAHIGINVIWSPVTFACFFTQGGVYELTRGPRLSLAGVVTLSGAVPFEISSLAVCHRQFCNSILDDGGEAD